MAAARRQPSAIREMSNTSFLKKFISRYFNIHVILAQLFQRSPPSTISFAGGSPNVSLFPFKDATITLTDDTTIKLDPSAMAKALQYLPTPGLPDMLTWFRKLQEHYHHPKDFDSYDLCITTGSMEGLAKVFELLLNQGDPILIDSPCYSGSLDFLRAFGADIHSIPTDSFGMSAKHLEETLFNWNDKNRLPKALYTIPNGSNPTGTTMSVERKKEIYRQSTGN
ncbi:unnamed protein product [Didymodactylos carnosus]|uniref:Aminotransferase class I/classII large domain-containing protein n=1 Tax=Didymodactylos carnosus TaxID=1234261 RepID=A0A8S2EM93_9BILA|nr:unnamed protein product [Didymodactylos carnosus]CAF4067697.1 unnamed protein product [Didymodactylos carnosus]